MADFTLAFAKMMGHEGAGQLTNLAADKGGQTYSGISRVNWPDWAGWAAVDRGERPEDALVADFYRINFWLPIAGESIAQQRIAESIFDFAVNVGVKASAKRAQEASCLQPDGVIGKMTLYALNSIDPQLFLARFALAKIAKYRDICTRDRSQMQFMLGWINRTLQEAI